MSAGCKCRPISVKRWSKYNCFWCTVCYRVCDVLNSSWLFSTFYFVECGLQARSQDFTLGAQIFEAHRTQHFWLLIERTVLLYWIKQALRPNKANFYRKKSTQSTIGGMSPLPPLATPLGFNAPNTPLVTVLCACGGLLAGRRLRVCDLQRRYDGPRCRGPAAARQWRRLPRRALHSWRSKLIAVGRRLRPVQATNR